MKTTHFVTNFLILKAGDNLRVKINKKNTMQKELKILSFCKQ